MIKDLATLEKNKLSTTFQGMNVCFYGEAGTGKTTIATQIAGEDNCLVLGFEDGFKGLEVRGIQIPNYQTFLQYIDQLEKPEIREKYPVLIVDTCTRLLEMVEQYVTSIYGKQTVAEIGSHGKGYPLINKYYNLAMDRIKAMNYTIYYITHSKEDEIKVGDEVVGYKSRPNLSDRGYNLIINECDYVFYLGYSSKDGERIMVTESTPRNFAKRRTPFPKVLPLDADIFAEEYKKGIEQKAKAETTTEAKKSTVVSHKKADRDYKVVVKEIQELGKKAKEKGILKEALDIVNKGLGTDEQNVQRTLDVVTQSNIEMLEVVKSQLEKLLA